MQTFWERILSLNVPNFRTRCNWRNSTQTTSWSSHILLELFNTKQISPSPSFNYPNLIVGMVKIYFQKFCLFGKYTHIACTNPLVAWKGLLGAELQGESQTSLFRWEPVDVRIFPSFFLFAFCICLFVRTQFGDDNLSHLSVVDRHKLTVFYHKSFDMNSVQVGKAVFGKESFIFPWRDCSPKNFHLDSQRHGTSTRESVSPGSLGKKF